MTLTKHSNYAIYLLVLVFTLGCSEADELLHGTIGHNGMVSSAHPVASAVGIDILKKGGNAYDAAIAVQFALAVVYPNAGNLGGGGFLVYRKSNGEIGSLDFREKAPMAADKNMYLDEHGEVIENLSTKGHLAAGVPGTVDGMFKMHQRLASMPFGELIEPAIKLAKNGVVLTEREANGINYHKQAFLDVNGAFYYTPEEPWSAGDTIHHYDLAATLTRIRDEGRDGFYGGTTAQLIVDEMMKGNGIITKEDLIAYQAVWREPVVGSFKSHRVIGMPPPSSGGVALLQLLKGIESYEIGTWGFNTAKTIHLMTELERRVYADRATFLGDPDFYNVPVEELTSDEYLVTRFSDVDLGARTSSENVGSGEIQVVESEETTHFSIVDKDGNAAAITTTLNGGFGSKVMVEGAGFFLNNEMDDFSMKPGVPNMFGLLGGEANAIVPEKRMLSSMTPTILEKDGALYMVVGTPGGSTIITSVFQTILNVTEHGMTMQEAVNARKFHHQWFPDQIDYEPNSLDADTKASLEKMGHKLVQRNSIGRMDAILVRDDGSLEGAADNTRGDNTAIGY